jgi:hypothetical protein
VSRCAAALGKRVLFLSDVTRWLADLGLNWERIGVSFEIAQNEIERQPVGIYLSVSQTAHAILCSAARTHTMHYISGDAAEVPPEERDTVRAELEASLDANWHGYVTRTLASAQPAA